MIKSSGVDLYLFGHNTEICDYSDVDKYAYEVDVEVNQDITDYVVEQITTVFSIFCEIGNKGGFSKSEVKLDDCNLSLIKIYFDTNNNIVAHLNVSSIEYNAYQLLRNMLDRLVLKKIFVSSIKIKKINSDDGDFVKYPCITDKNENALYPHLAIYNQVQVTGEDGDYSKVRRCLYETNHKISKLEVESIISCVEPWYLSLEFGAFALPLANSSEITSSAGVVTIFDPYTVEISVNCFLASEAAWNVLINLLAKRITDSNEKIIIVVD